MARMSAADAYLGSGFVAMAHRGGALLPRNLGIENTLTAFRHAMELGIRYLETDVHATSDGQLVAFHDASLDRVTDTSGEISKLTYDEVRRVTVGGREQIPSLDELFESFPDARINLDIKAAGAVRPLATAIRRHAAQHRVCVGSFSHPRLTAFRRLLPDVLTAVSPVGVMALSRGLVRRRGVGRVFQIPLHHRVGPTTVRILTPERVAAIHRTGRTVHVWTINSTEQMHELIDWGVDGIVTDRPDLLKEVLQNRGMWSTR